MKPVNKKSLPCSPVSSNCVIWQGDDISCLNLCKGDTVSEVVHQIACLVCSLKDELDPDTYDLTCLQIATCDIPHTFKDFVQLLIERICNIEATCCNGGESNPANEQTVVVASCFVTGGAIQTIANYIQAIGQKVCEQEITIQNQQLAIQQLIARVEVLESYH